MQDQCDAASSRDFHRCVVRRIIHLDHRKGNDSAPTAAWFSRLKGTAGSHDPKATVSYIVARDGETLLDAGFEPESLQRVRDDFTAGTLLQERYRLIRELGRGGMGISATERSVGLEKRWCGDEAGIGGPPRCQSDG